MAKIIPDGWREVVVTGGAQREIETLAVLANELPETYRVYHAVHWTNIGAGKGFSIYGEIDFVVVNQAGDLLLIEHKSGLLEETPEGLVKRVSAPRWPGTWPRLAQALRSSGSFRPSAR